MERSWSPLAYLYGLYRPRVGTLSMVRQCCRKMFVGSEQVKALAKSRGKVPEEKLIMSGLPIRHDFAVQAENMGDRMSVEGKAYQRKIRKDLGLPFTDRKTILVMGGGEGNGAKGIDALILVVCGRNEELKKMLETRDWREVFNRWNAAKERSGQITKSCSFQHTGQCCQYAMSQVLARRNSGYYATKLLNPQSLQTVVELLDNGLNEPRV
jgi:hypothetical protein